LAGRFKNHEQPVKFRGDSAGRLCCFFGVSFTELLAQLPALSVSERQLLARRALDLDEPALSEKVEAVAETSPGARDGHHWQRRI
jgi:hypothetical protein